MQVSEKGCVEDFKICRDTFEGPRRLSRAGDNPTLAADKYPQFS
jgi:hypothetical protein